MPTRSQPSQKKLKRTVIFICRKGGVWGMGYSPQKPKQARSHILTYSAPQLPKFKSLVPSAPQLPENKWPSHQLPQTPEGIFFSVFILTPVVV